jgi:hypothetical protein
MDASNFRRVIMTSAEWPEVIAEFGLEVASGPRGAKGLRPIADGSSPVCRRELADE